MVFVNSVFNRLFQWSRLSAGQYFDIKIDYVDITQEEFNKRIAEKKETLKNLFAESADLGSAILKDLETLEFHEDVK